jgi:hypothetical protein
LRFRRHAKIAYRWHPLFGRTFQISPFQRGKGFVCIHTDDRPDLSRELPTWMLDESYCTGMTSGSAQVSIEGLNELAAVLASRQDCAGVRRAKSKSMRMSTSSKR